MEIELDALRASALAVRTELEEHHQALAEKIAVEGEILDLAIEAAQPALCAICSRVIRVNDPSDDAGVVEYFETNGIVIAEASAGQLVLCENGSLAVVSDTSDPDDTGYTREWAHVTSTHAMIEFDLMSCLNGIKSAIDKQKGKRRNATTKVRKQIDDLREIKSRLERSAPPSARKTPAK